MVGIRHKIVRMDRDPIETAEVLAFLRTAEARSLTRAANELGLPRATVSRRLARLEERLAVRLLRRTTRSIALTDAGETFLRHARILRDAVEHAESSVRRTDDVVRGDLRVSVPPMRSESFFAMTAEFALRHPDVRLHVFFSTAPVDLRRDGWDVALRAGTHLEPGLVARRIARSKLIAVASPAYLSRHGAPRTLRDLRRHRLLLSYGRDDVPQTHWPSKSGSLHVEGVFYSNDTNLLTDAVRRGLGIAMIPNMYARHLIDSGDLVPVLPAVLEAETQVAVVYAEREFVPPQVRAFVDALVAWAPSELERIPRERHTPSARATDRPPPSRGKRPAR